MTVLWCVTLRQLTFVADCCCQLNSLCEHEPQHTFPASCSTSSTTCPHMAFRVCTHPQLLAHQAGQHGGHQLVQVGLHLYMGVCQQALQGLQYDGNESGTDPQTGGAEVLRAVWGLHCSIRYAPKAGTYAELCACILYILKDKACKSP